MVLHHSPRLCYILFHVCVIVERPYFTRRLFRPQITATFLLYVSGLPSVNAT